MFREDNVEKKYGKLDTTMFSLYKRCGQYAITQKVGTLEKLNCLNV